MDQTDTLIQLTDITRRYDANPAVDDLSLTINRGEVMVLLGPSGCGKTTTLRLIAGLERPDAGTIHIDGVQVAGPGTWLPPEKRRVGLVFQDYALFPHLDVAANITFGLNGWPRKRKAERVQTMLDLVGLPGLGGRMPNELSGGQQQRVALARALAPEPAVLLLDEPFSNLDAALRAQVRVEVRDILRAASTTSIFVTHDQEEALSMADRVTVMFNGKAAQVGPPQIVYTRPASPQVAAFVGEANFIPGKAQGRLATCALGQVPLVQPAEGAVMLMIRPEVVLLGEREDNAPAAATVKKRDFFGHAQRLTLALDDGTVIIVRTDAFAVFRVGQRVGLIVGRPVQAFAQVQAPAF